MGLFFEFGPQSLRAIVWIAPDLNVQIAEARRASSVLAFGMPARKTPWQKKRDATDVRNVETVV